MTGERRRARELLHHCRPLLDIEPRHLHRVATSRRHVFDCRSALSVEPPRAASHMVSNRHVFNCRSAASYRAETCFLLQDRMQPDTLNGKFETKEPVQSENKLTRGVPISTSLSTRRQPTRCAASASGPTAPRAAPTYATAACATPACATPVPAPRLPAPCLPHLAGRSLSLSVRSPALSQPVLRCTSHLLSLLATTEPRTSHFCVHELGCQTPSFTNQIDKRCSSTPRTTARSRPTRARTGRR